MKTRSSESFGVIGLSKFGIALATELARSGKEVICVDTDEEPVKLMRAYTEHAYVTETYSVDALREIGMQNCDTLIVAIDGQLDTSILTTLCAVELGVHRVIAKAESRDHGKVLERIGAEVINPENDMALRLSKRLVTGAITDYISIGADNEISEIPVSASLNGKTVLESDLRHRYGINIIALEHAETTSIHITPDTRLLAGDMMVVIGRSDDIRRLENLK